MFGRALIVSILFILIVFGSAFYRYAIPRASDLSEYRQWKKEKAPRAFQKEPAFQKRTCVRKDFWIPKEGRRSRLSIISENSELILIERKGKIEATELLTNLTGILFENKEERRFSALEGIYFHPTNRFLSKDAEFMFIRNGNPSPFLKGSAKTTDFSLLGTGPLFKAEQAELKSSDSCRVLGDQVNYSSLSRSLELSPACFMELPNATLKCEGPLTIHLEENTAETALPFHYEDAEFRIEGSSGKLLYAKNIEGRVVPQTVHCEGAVRLASEENYALADELVYFPETRMLHLFAKNGGRVLFWKSDGSIQISAPEVSAHLAGKETEEIRGIGDVHFTFDLEEEHRIEALFGKYL